MWTISPRTISNIYGEGVRNMKKILKTIGLVILGLIVLGVVFGGNSKTGTSNNTASKTEVKATPTPEKISARELADNFDANQVAAEAKWSGKLIEFSAKITNITDSGLSFAEVASKDFSLAQISCKIKDKQQLMSLKNGQTVTVQGVVGKQTIGVIDISDCEVVIK